jgi:hypothetical protein
MASGSVQLLLTVAAVTEAATGAALLALPALMLSLLLGGALDTTGLADDIEAICEMVAGKGRPSNVSASV